MIKNKTIQNEICLFDMLYNTTIKIIKNKTQMN